MLFPPLEKTINGHDMEIHAHVDESGELTELHLWCYSHPEGESVCLIPVDNTLSGKAAGEYLINKAETHAQGEIDVDSTDH